MPTKVYRTPPVTPNAHLAQLTALKDAKESDLSKFQKLLRKTLLSERSLKAMRLIHIREMVIAGYPTEQIKLAFVAVESPLNALVDGLQTESGARIFHNEIMAAITECADLNADDYRTIYVESRQRLLDACWGFLGSIEPPQAKALIELMDKLQQDVAESHGAIHQRAGKRPSTLRQNPTSGPGEPPASEVADAESALSGDDPDQTKFDWEGAFEADDAEDNVSSEKQ